MHHIHIVRGRLYRAITFLFIDFKENTPALWYNTFNFRTIQAHDEHKHESFIDFGFMLSISFDNDNACLLQQAQHEMRKTLIFNR